jgi:hypothetical protein
MRVIEKQIQFDKSSILAEINKKYKQAKNNYFAALEQTRQ